MQLGCFAIINSVETMESRHKEHFFHSWPLGNKSGALLYTQNPSGAKTGLIRGMPDVLLIIYWMPQASPETHRNQKLNH